MTEPLLPPDLLVDAPPLTDDDLDQYLAWASYTGDPFDDGAPPSGRAGDWSVEGPGDANWAFAMYAQYDAERAALLDLKDVYVARIDQWYRDAASRPTRLLAYFADRLCAYGLAERERTGGAVKTTATPNGSIKTTAHKAKVAVDADEVDALIEWAEKHAPAAVKIAKSMLLEPLRVAVTILEVPTRLVFSPCACVVEIDPHEELDGDDLAAFVHNTQIGTGTTCPSCGGEALIGRWLATCEVAVDKNGLRVPGAYVQPANVTASLSPS